MLRPIFDVSAQPKETGTVRKDWTDTVPGSYGPVAGHKLSIHLAASLNACAAEEPMVGSRRSWSVIRVDTAQCNAGKFRG